MLPLALILVLFAGDPWPRMRAIADRHLGRPYVWGSAGLRTFDCSGFVWRILFEDGYLLKRTTARKLYLSLESEPQGEERWQPGTLVFFDNLKHVGLVASRDHFYQAQVSKGTNLSPFDPFWRPQICGFRKLPR